MNQNEQGVIAIINKTDKETLISFQKFQGLLNDEPPADAIDKTPDGNAKTVLISHVEMTLDELFFGQWSTRNFTSKLIANEVCGELELCCLHPVTGREIIRTGSAAIQIMVDKLNDQQKATMSSQQRNQWALDPSNKKPNALDLAYPKLKAECLKNAAQSLGKIFGRDLNRKRSDSYKPIVKGDLLAPIPEEQFNKLLEAAKDPLKIDDVQQVLELNFDAEQKQVVHQALQLTIKTVQNQQTHEQPI
jgi:hypothetical protein